MFAPLPIGLALLAASLAYFHFFGDKQLRDEDGKGATPARTQSYFAKAYGIDGDVYELTVTADSPLVGMSLGEAEALHSAPLLLALKSGNEARLAPPADTRIWVGSVLGAMGPRQQVSDFAQNHFLRLSLAPAQLRRPVQSQPRRHFRSGGAGRRRSSSARTAATCSCASRWA